MNGISASDWIPIAHLLRPQGRRGELLAEPLSDVPGIFAPDRELLLVACTTQTPTSGPLHAPTPTHIQEHWFPTGKNAGRVVLKLSGCDTISDAETLAGKQLLIASSHLPILDPDTFFVGDLVGCAVFDAAIPVGSVVDVEFPTGPDGRTRLEDAAPLLAVQLTPKPAQSPPPDGTATANSEPVLIPFVRAWLESVDIPARRLVMHLPAGLLDDTLPPLDEPS